MTGMSYIKRQSHIGAFMFTCATVVLATIAHAAINFAPMDPTWSIPMQITTNGTANGVYSPVSVITPSMDLRVTFGVTNTATTAATLPRIVYKIVDANGGQQATWQKSFGTSLPANRATCIDDGGLCTSYVRSLPTGGGNYRLEVKIGSAGDVKYFRFAVPDASKSVSDAFSGAWTNITTKSGNDFAAAPFATGTAATGIDSGSIPTVQFGPYVPMDGIISAGSSVKALDLVLLIDDTGSMNNCIKGLLGNLSTFISQLLRGDPANNIDPIDDLRIKIVGFIDYKSDRTSYNWFEEYAFTTNIVELQNHLDYLKRTKGGGGNGGESCYEALYYICKGWKPNATRNPTGVVATSSPFRDKSEASRAVILFTDEPPHIPLYADGCMGLSTNEVDAALREANINLTIIGDKLYRRNEGGGNLYVNGWVHSALVGMDPDTRTLIEPPTPTSGWLATYTEDASKIRALADMVSKDVMAVVVEPLLSAKVTGPGVLTYEWRNMSAAGTNNTFTFKVSGISESIETRPASTSDAWTTQTYSLGSGDYTCQWFYRKLGYGDGLIDCGQVRNVTWLRAGIPVAMEILGPATVNSGGTASYTARVTYEDGSVTENMVTEADWYVSSGGSYASIGAHTGVLSANVITGSDKTVTVAAAFEVAGVRVSATKTVTVLAPPEGPVVTATDGTDTEKVSVNWTISSSSGTISSYEVSRAEKGKTTWTTVATTKRTYCQDKTALPGVDYTYRVRAQNASGWGSYGSDDGWRKVLISLSPDTLTCDYQAYSAPVTVTSNTTWEITGQTGCASATAGVGKITVSVGKNDTLASRPGSVTVTAGRGTAHPESATVDVTQGKRPAILTKLEITGGDRTLEGGESTTFRAIATFDDGTTRDVTTESTWTITSGNGYGTVSNGALTTYETTDIGAGMTVQATYTNSGYSTVTKTDSVDVAITFSSRLRRPVSLTINGTNMISIGETKTYTATVAYNDGTTADKTFDAEWSVTPGGYAAKIVKGASDVALTAYSGVNGGLTIKASYSEKVAAISGLVACYNLNGNTLDTSGYGNHGVVHGAVPTDGRNGEPNNAYLFDGNDWIQVANSPSLRVINNQISISTWVKPTAWASNVSGSWVPVVCKGLTERQYGLQVRNDGRYDFKDEYGVSVDAGLANVLQLGEWQHIAMTYDGSVMRAYLNGKLVGETRISRSFTANDDDLYIGYDRPGQIEYLTGAIDDIRIFNRALSVEEIASVATENGETVTVTGTKNVMMPMPIDLAVAVDLKDYEGGPWKYAGIEGMSTSSSVAGGNVWYGQSAASHDGEDAGRSGYMAGAGTNTMTVVVTNAGTVSFWWKVSSEPVYDTLSFSIDGVMKAQISGTADDWRQLTFNVGAGAHTLTWSYCKDGENADGLDTGWVDQIVWTSLRAPAAPTSVRASDGTSSNGVDVTWTVPSSQVGGVAESYEISRAVKGSGAWSVLVSNLVGVAWTDLTAEPGVDYTYRVRGMNVVGGGEYGQDDGWRGIVLVVDPETLEFASVAGSQDFTVQTTASSWSASRTARWITLTKGNTNETVAVNENTSLSARTNWVTVVAGVNHAVTARVEVVQAGRPPKLDVGFAAPFEDWRTRMQISTNTTPDEVYAPVSVFTADELLDVSFGWTNKSEAVVSMPALRFRILKPGVPDDICIAEWTEPGRSGETLGVRCGAWSGHWTNEVLKVLKPGDYLLEADIAPTNLYNDIDRSDNTAVFRFAVRDPALDAASASFTEEKGWMSVDQTQGNDFAQPPHFADRTGSAGTNEVAVQFGPYVPMNGINGRRSEVKKPLDLVFLIDYTGSMSGCIAGLLNNIGIFIDQLFLGDPANGIDPIEDLRVKIVGFNDTANYSLIDWFHEGVFTSDRTILKNDLAWLRDKCNYGSGNGGESSFDALYYISKGWKPVDPRQKNSPHVDTDEARRFRGTNEASRVVILFTDEPALMPFTQSRYSTLTDTDDGYGKDEAYCMNLLDRALKEANINLTIIGDGYYHGSNSLYANNIHRFADLVNGDPEMRELINFGGYSGALATFSGDADLLRGLATNVTAKVAVEAKVVEPVFSATLRGGGALMFDWKNDSSAGTNNTFSFVCEGVTNLTKAAGEDWENVALELGEGVHVFNWSYGKLGGYTNNVVTDCGVLSNVRWEPWQTELEIEPPRVPTYYTGVPVTQTNDANNVLFDVKCNSIWRVVDHSDWITIVQGSGSGDGGLLVNVATNDTYADRLGYIVVRAGEYGLPSDALLGIVEKKVFIEQEANPYGEDGSVEVLTVDVKPRWPWSRKVDIDFRVKTPKADGTTPVRVKVWGLNKEGGSMIENYPTIARLQECAAKNGVEVGFGSTNFTPIVINQNTSSRIGGIDSDGMAYIVCTNSGLYRFTWDMADDWHRASGAACTATGMDSTFSPWANGAAGTFHTPEFSVRLRVEPERARDSTNPFHELEAKETRRVDMRLLPLSNSDSGHSTGREGGSILTGSERIGHPFGYADPIVVDTTDKSLFPSNGWNNLDFMDDEWELQGFGKGMLTRNGSYALTNRYDIACVINDNHVAIEGGMITNDVHWTSDKIHVVRDNVFVTRGAKLTIDAETIVKVCVDTRIYVLEDETENIVTNQHNIVVEGSYLVRAVNQSYGGDTLYLPSANTSESLAEGQGIVYSQVKQGQTIETEEIVGSKRCSNRAIYRLELKEQLLDANGKVSAQPSRYKYYGRGQPYGEILPPSEPGCAFYGWYKNQPKNNRDLTSSILASGYLASQTDFVNLEDCPYNLTKAYNSSDEYVWALVCPTNWANVANSILRSASDGRIVLTTESVIYDGTDHAGDIKIKELWLCAVNISNSIASVNIPNPCVNVGRYPVSVNFAADYRDSPTNYFEILPRSTEGGRITFSPASMMYQRTLTKPNVTVSLPGMASIPSGDYTIDWPDKTRWPNGRNSSHPPRPGKYMVVASFNGNYTGPAITNEFEITVNPEYVYKEYNTESAARNAVAAKPRTADNTADRRILYIGGRENDVLTEYVKELLTNDIDLCDYISENFVCWADDIDASGSKVAMYSEGLNTDLPPILAIVSVNDMTRAITNHSGYITRDDLWKFLNAAKTLPDNASSATLTLSSTEFTYTGGDLRPQVVVRYAGKTVSSNDYELVWSGNCRSVGTYEVKAVFDGNPYVGETEPAVFRIVPAQIDPLAVKLSLNGVEVTSTIYNGGLQRPDVSVSGCVLESVDYGAGDYISAGAYTVAVTVSGNYTGTVRKAFTISRRRVSSATIVLDSYRAEINTNKLTKSTRIEPYVIEVSDATRVYQEGIDYSLAWNPNDFTSAGTNTITATFQGNYIGRATAEFVIEVVEAATSSIDPAVGASVVVKANSVAEAIAKVEIAVPAAAKSAGVSDADYRAYFTMAATDNGDGTWTVTAELNPEVVLPEAEADELGQELLEAVLDVSASGATITTAKPGLYYRLAGCHTPNGRYDKGTVVLATGREVTLSKPTITGTGNAVFYKVIVSAAP